MLVDEKGFYYFGRNPTQCDFLVEHASCSRVHAILLYHKLLKKFALVDLQSSMFDIFKKFFKGHGTFVSNTRIEPLKPVFMDFDATFNFGVSTRKYTLRSRIVGDSTTEDNEKDGVENETYVLEKDIELENITEFNTAQNRRVIQIPITLEEGRRKKRPRNNISFAEEEDIINPGYFCKSLKIILNILIFLEDVDPSIGRFRNMVRTAVIPTNKASKKRTSDVQSELFDFYAPDKKLIHHKTAIDSSDENPRRNNEPNKSGFVIFIAINLFLGFFNRTSMSYLRGLVPSLNAAPDLDLYAVCKEDSDANKAKFHNSIVTDTSELEADGSSGLHHKKKYAKEAWPGRKSTNVL